MLGREVFFIYNNMKQELVNKKILGIRNLIISLIILAVLAIIYPFIVAFVYLVTAIFGQPFSYLVGGLVAHLYAPILASLCISIVYVLIKGVRWNLLLNRRLFDTQINMPKAPLKLVFIAIFIAVAGALYLFGTLKEEVYLIQDIPHLANSDFAQTEGILTLYKKTVGDEPVTRILINGIKMDGGSVSGEDLIENAKYSVKYLPHSKYVVEYHQID